MSWPRCCHRSLQDFDHRLLNNIADSSPIGGRLSFDPVNPREGHCLSPLAIEGLIFAKKGRRTPQAAQLVCEISDRGMFFRAYRQL
jgi:hypothetical protein